MSLVHRGWHRHEKFDAEFVDAEPLRSAKLPEQVVAEVTQRTPGYESWQQEEWLVCCEDACEFHGEAPADELRSFAAQGLERLADTTGFTTGDLQEIVPQYAPGGSPAFYKFVCRHCGEVRFGGDCD